MDITGYKICIICARERREAEKASDSVGICFLLGKLHLNCNEHPKQRVSETSFHKVEITI